MAEVVKMPFGLVNSAATFQKLTDGKGLLLHDKPCTEAKKTQIMYVHKGLTIAFSRGFRDY